MFKNARLEMENSANQIISEGNMEKKFGIFTENMCQSLIKKIFPVWDFARKAKLDFEWFLIVFSYQYPNIYLYILMTIYYSNRICIIIFIIII